MEMYFLSDEIAEAQTWWNSIFRREQFLTLKRKQDISKMHLALSVVARRFFAKARSR